MHGNGRSSSGSSDTEGHVCTVIHDAETDAYRRKHTTMARKHTCAESGPRLCGVGCGLRRQQHTIHGSTPASFVHLVCTEHELSCKRKVVGRGGSPQAACLGTLAACLAGLPQAQLLAIGYYMRFPCRGVILSCWQRED